MHNRRAVTNEDDDLGETDRPPSCNCGGALTQIGATKAAATGTEVSALRRNCSPI